MRVIVLLAVAVMALFPELSAGQPTTSPTSSDFSPVREFIKTEMGIGTSTPSLAVAVARGREILWEEGFGWIDRPGGTRATPHTLYYAASVTKAITSTAVMVLHERRQLDLDRPANLYLKAAKLRSPHWNADEVTIRHLATHTAGLATYDNRDDIPGMETIRRYGIVFTRPGETFDYSNLGFGILGQIIADVSGRSFRAFVQEEVLRPLAMANAWAGAAPKSRYPVAPRYNSQLKTFSSPHPEPRLPGSSVLYCSVHELALFGMFHLKTRHPRQKAILSSAAIDRLQEPAVPAGNRRQSLAWSITDNQHGYRTLLAQGGTYDSQAWLLLVPSERIVVVALANAGNVAVSSTIDRILSVLLPVYRENLAAAVSSGAGGTAAPTTSPSTAPSELVGTWSGEIHTHRGNVPLAMTITSSGDVSATLSKQPSVNMTNVRTANDRVIGRMHGDLGVDYVGTPPYQLRFALRRVGNKLIGSAVTYAADVGRVPLWVELRRGEYK